MPEQRIDLNSDLGESFGAYSIGMDNEVLSFVTSANIACGFHAGDHNVMGQTVKKAKENGVGIGAHPGLPDLIGFGRRPMEIDSQDVYNLVAYQIGALQAFCNIHDVKMQHVKAHGALYNMACKNQAISEAIARAARDVNPDLILFGLSGSELLKAGEKYGLQTASEVFADRTYQPDGSLTSRSQDNAMITDTESSIQQVLGMVFDGKVTAVDGSEVPIQADTICVHGDGPHAVQFVSELKNRLKKEGIEIQRVGG